MKTFLTHLSEIWGEPEDSNFTHNGHDYDLNGLLSATLGAEKEDFPVSELTWIFKWDPMGSADRTRIKNADLSAPVLINKLKGQWVVLDGIHRLAKAVKDKDETIPAIKVSDELLARYLIK